MDTGTQAQQAANVQDTAAVSRRQSLLLGLATGTVVLGGMDGGRASAKHADNLLHTIADEAPRFFKTSTGVKIQEISPGDITSGVVQVADIGDTVLFDYVLRRANGYFIYSTVEGVSFQPKDVPVGPISVTIGKGQIIRGLEEVLVGMAPGAKRRALVPPEVGYVRGDMKPQPPTFATQRQLENHRTEPLLFEVQLLRINGKK